MELKLTMFFLLFFVAAAFPEFGKTKSTHMETECLTKQRKEGDLMEKNNSLWDTDLKLPKGKIRYGLTNDYMFRAVLQKNNNVLKHLLAALLKISVSEIASCEITNPIVLGESIDDKSCVMDIRILLNNQRLINLEMQIGHLENWPNRSLFYLSRLFCNIHPGENYNLIKPSIHIGILTEQLFDDVKDFYSEYLMMNTKNQRIFSRNFSLRVLQLSQLETASEAEKASELYQWAKLFLAKTWEELQMVAKNSNIMQETTKCLYELSEEENIRLLCEGRERYRMDMDCARDEGFEHGLQSGEIQKLVELICKKIEKKYSVLQIADLLEEDESTVQIIYDVAKSFSPDYNVNAIMGKLKETAGHLFKLPKDNTFI